MATADHNVPTTDRSLPILDPVSKQQIDTLRENCRSSASACTTWTT
jgi:3-isopropylmalate/(R)-2-methylmalate dehydratase large subunit